MQEVLQECVSEWFVGIEKSQKKPPTKYQLNKQMKEMQYILTQIVHNVV